MCIPQTETGRQGPPALSAALAQLDSTREEVVQEVRRAPERRVDNIVTRLNDSARLLQMHAIIHQMVRKQYNSEWWTKRLGVAGVLAGGTALTASAVTTGAPLSFSLTAGICALLGTCGVEWYAQRSIRKVQEVRL